MSDLSDENKTSGPPPRKSPGSGVHSQDPEVGRQMSMSVSSIYLFLAFSLSALPHSESGRNESSSTTALEFAKRVQLVAKLKIWVFW